MKCQLCGVEVEGDAAVESAALTVFTNAKPGVGFTLQGGIAVPNVEPSEEPFVAVFGFWNQRTKTVFEICGACLCDRLADGACHQTMTDLRERGVDARTGVS